MLRDVIGYSEFYVYVLETVFCMIMWYEKWLLKKVKRRLPVNQYQITLLDNNIEVYCSTGHKFGDMLEEAIKSLP